MRVEGKGPKIGNGNGNRKDQVVGGWRKRVLGETNEIRGHFRDELET